MRVAHLPSQTDTDVIPLPGGFSPSEVLASLKRGCFCPHCNYTTCNCDVLLLYFCTGSEGPKIYDLLQRYQTSFESQSARSELGIPASTSAHRNPRLLLSSSTLTGQTTPSAHFMSAQKVRNYMQLSLRLTSGKSRYSSLMRNSPQRRLPIRASHETTPYHGLVRFSPIVAHCHSVFCIVAYQCNVP
jgi:hypothetical protein